MEVSSREGAPELRDVLATLDDRGCSFLVAGAAGGGSFDAVARTLNGSPDLDRRRVVLALGTSGTGAALPDGVQPGDPTVRHVERSATRGTAAQSPASRGPLDADSLARLRAEVDDAVASLEPAGGYDPGDLRVTVRTLDPLLGDVRSGRLRRWTDALAGRVTDDAVNGRIAFFAHRPMDHPTLQSLHDAVDVRITVARRPGGLAHRWVVTTDAVPDREQPYRTDWLPLPA
ncbi:MAG: hypothetical protein V5A23_08660 [Halobacteriales archaeon]